MLLPIAAGVIVLAGVGIWFSTRKPADKPQESAAVTPVPEAPTPAASAVANPAATVRTQQPNAKRAEAPSKTAPAVVAAPAQVTPAPSAAPVAPVVVAANTPAPAPIQAAPVVAPPVAQEKPSAVAAPAPAPAPVPVVAAPPPPAPVVVAAAPAPAPVARATESDDQRKAADSASRRAVDDALNRYRAAFESKDADALKSVWPNLGKSEFSSIQNFFKIARTVKLQLRTEGDPEITAAGASVRARRTMAATDERGALPQQDQTVKITLRRVASAMVIESVVPVNR